MTRCCAQLDSGGSAGQSSQTREAFLIQKRELKLDRPILLNFDGFRNYAPAVTAAAHFSGLPRPTDRRVERLAGTLRSTPAERARLAFLVSLSIKDFDERLADPSQRPSLATAVRAYAQTFCEDSGSPGVPAAMAILDSDADRRKNRCDPGLESMVLEPFEYSFSRPPRRRPRRLACRAPGGCGGTGFMTSSGRSTPIARPMLREPLAAMSAETDRGKLFDPLENLIATTRRSSSTCCWASTRWPTAIAANFLVMY